MSDIKKDHRELKEEIEALRRQLETQARSGGNEPSLAGRVTRRTALKAWIAPVLVSVPLAARSAATRRTEDPKPEPPSEPSTASPTPVAPTAEVPPSQSPTPVAPTLEAPSPGRG